MRLLTQGFETKTVAGFSGSALAYTPSPRISGVAVDTSNLTFQLHDLKEDDITRTQVYTRFAYGIRQYHLDQEVSTRFRIRDSQNVTLLSKLRFIPILLHLLILGSVCVKGYETTS